MLETVEVNQWDSSTEIWETKIECILQLWWTELWMVHLDFPRSRVAWGSWRMSKNRWILTTHSLEEKRPTEKTISFAAIFSWLAFRLFFGGIEVQEVSLSSARWCISRVSNSLFYLGGRLPKCGPIDQHVTCKSQIWPTLVHQSTEVSTLQMHRGSLFSVAGQMYQGSFSEFLCHE